MKTWTIEVFGNQLKLFFIYFFTDFTAARNENFFTFRKFVELIVKKFFNWPLRAGQVAWYADLHAQDQSTQVCFGQIKIFVKSRLEYIYL